jgi:hypothetical protein
MKPFLHSILCGALVALISCAQTETVVTGYSKAGQPIGSAKANQFLYGKLNAEVVPFGLTHSGNMDVGFKYLTQMITTLAGAIYYGNLQLEKETTQQLATAGLNKVQIEQIHSALAAELAKSGYAGTVNFAKSGAFNVIGAATQH